MKKHYYVCVEFTKNHMRKYYYQYCQNKAESTKLLNTLKRQNKTLIGWIDFIWDNNINLPESVNHGKMFTQTKSLLNEL